MKPGTPAEQPEDSLALKLRALTRHRSRLRRKLEAQRRDLAEAERADELRRFGETLLAYLQQVPAHAASVTLPDPANQASQLEIALDARLRPQENAARYFKRAAKAERGLQEIPPRMAAVEAELLRIEHLIERARRVEEHQPLPEGGSIAHLAEPDLEREIDEALKRLPARVRQGATARATRSAAGTAAARERRAVPGRLQPRRLKSREGWEVMVGRSNEGNDHLTHRLARPEDYWFHVHGAAGSHVVLKRGKGKNEPSKQTIEEVSAWAAFYSQARHAGKVPVIVTRKKYVRKPRKAPPGLAVCEREKTVMVRPQEPPRSALETAEEGG